MSALAVCAAKNHKEIAAMILAESKYSLDNICGLAMELAREFDNKEIVEMIANHIAEKKLSAMNAFTIQLPANASYICRIRLASYWKTGRMPPPLEYDAYAQKKDKTLIPYPSIFGLPPNPEFLISDSASFEKKTELRFLK